MNTENVLDETIVKPGEKSFLAGLRVLDLSDEKGMHCGKLLGDLGADVIQVEPPGGSPARDIGPFYHDQPDPEKSLFWFAFNANKRGITLKLESADGRDLFRSLAVKSDVVVESYPPGYLDGLGLGYKALSRLNPRLVMTSVTPFGLSGQFRDLPACDLTLQAMSCFTIGEPDRAPTRWGGEQSLALPGFAAAAATVIALYSREITGEGQQVDVSARECLTWAAGACWRFLFWEFQRQIPKREGNLSGRGIVIVNSVFPCKDGSISWRIWPGTMGRLTRRVVEWMDSVGQAGELRDIQWSRVDVNKTRQEDWDRWEQAFGSFFRQFTKKDIYEAAVKWGFFAVPVAGPTDILENPQLIDRGYFVPVEHPELDATIIYPGSWFRSTEVEAKLRRAPLIGEHNEQIYLGELGLSKEDLCRLKEMGIV